MMPIKKELAKERSKVKVMGIGGEHRGVFVEIVKGRAVRKGGRTRGMVERKGLLHGESIIHFSLFLLCI